MMTTERYPNAHRDLTDALLDADLTTEMIRDAEALLAKTRRMHRRATSNAMDEVILYHAGKRAS